MGEPASNAMGARITANDHVLLFEKDSIKGRVEGGLNPSVREADSSEEEG